MYSELYGVIVGGVIGILGGIGSVFFSDTLKKRQNKISAKVVAISEITVIKERAKRLLDGRSSPEQFCAASTMLVPISSILSYLCNEQLSTFMEVLILDKESKIKDADGKLDSTTITLLINACDKSLELLK